MLSTAEATGVFAITAVVGLQLSVGGSFAAVFLREEFIWPFGPVITLVSAHVIIGLGFFSAILCSELIVDLGYRCWLRVHPTRHNPRVNSLISQGDRASTGHLGLTLSVREYVAVDVMRVDLASIQDGARIRSLPTQLVQLPVKDTSQIAVLSWRWDFQNDSSQDTSQNVALAIRYAKSSGIRYLFIDVISLDQTLAANHLIEEVARFGALYKYIPVIAAYDDPSSALRFTMLRPWIHSEIKLMLSNPYQIMYIGYCQQGTYIYMSMTKWLFGHVLLSQTSRTEYAKRLRLVWASDFVRPILEVLNGNAYMADIHDFKLILPVLSEVLIVAEKLPRNDYLLTVALLASASTQEANRRYRTDTDFRAFTYTQFEIHSTVRNQKRKPKNPNGTHDSVSHSEVHTITWCGVELATLRFSAEVWNENWTPRYEMELNPDMESSIFEMLGLGVGSEIFRRYMADVDERRAFLGDQRAVTNPNIKMVEFRK